eukprot:TRINITY_DN19320_c0_g1_i3.p1 TRINITY_DN19320_c0_g1~~TRINITY_DN19320_c0_g1_i3.p1  ORF type:complete len:705 (-),score=157.13 TRINITY_DN19320_c0_g1_i3:83-2026(-)
MTVAAATSLHKAARRLGFMSRKSQRSSAGTGGSSARKLLKDGASTVYKAALTVQASLTAAADWCEAATELSRQALASANEKYFKDETSASRRPEHNLKKTIHAFVFSKHTDTSDLPLLAAFGCAHAMSVISVEGFTGKPPRVLNSQRVRAAPFIEICLSQETILCEAALILLGKRPLLGVILTLLGQENRDRDLDLRLPNWVDDLGLGPTLNWLLGTHVHFELFYCTILTGLTALMGSSTYATNREVTPFGGNKATCVDFLGLLKVCGDLGTDLFDGMQVSFSSELLKLKYDTHNRLFFNWRKARDYAGGIQASQKSNHEEKATPEQADSGLSTDTSLHAGHGLARTRKTAQLKQKINGDTIAARKVIRGWRIRRTPQIDSEKEVDTRTPSLKEDADALLELGPAACLLKLYAFKRSGFASTLEEDPEDEKDLHMPPLKEDDDALLLLGPAACLPKRYSLKRLARTLEEEGLETTDDFEKPPVERFDKEIESENEVDTHAPSLKEDADALLEPGPAACIPKLYTFKRSGLASTLEEDSDHQQNSRTDAEDEKDLHMPLLKEDTDALLLLGPAACLPKLYSLKRLARTLEEDKGLETADDLEKPLVERFGKDFLETKLCSSWPGVPGWLPLSRKQKLEYLRALLNSTA